MQRKRVIWMAMIRPNIGNCFPLIPYRCFLRPTIKKSDELAKAYSKKIHCKKEIGSMQSKIANTKHIFAYPYKQINLIRKELHLVMEVYFP